MTGWWGPVKKTVKEEAHHYWVSKGGLFDNVTWEGWGLSGQGDLGMAGVAGGWGSRKR